MLAATSLRYLSKTVKKVSKLSSSVARGNCVVRATSFKAPSRTMATYVNPPLPYNHFEFQTCVELQEKASAMFGDNKCLGTKNGDKFDWMTYKQLGEEVQKFRNVLASKNFKFDDKCAIISNNRAEWVVIMYATMSMGGQLVPM